MKQFIASGNLDVLGELYTRYMHLVYGVCLKYLRNREDAQDAVMQIFEKLIGTLQNHEVRNFKNWLYVLTRNHCLMVLRSKKAEDNRIVTDDFDKEFMESREELHPLDRDDGIAEKALSDCIAHLKKEQRDCVELFYFQKLCYEEIARKLSLEVKNVKSHLQNGKRNLKICLEKKNVR